MFIKSNTLSKSYLTLLITVRVKKPEFSKICSVKIFADSYKKVF